MQVSGDTPSASSIKPVTESTPAFKLYKPLLNIAGLPRNTVQGSATKLCSKPLTIPVLRNSLRVY